MPNSKAWLRLLGKAGDPLTAVDQGELTLILHRLKRNANFE